MERDESAPADLRLLQRLVAASWARRLRCAIASRAPPSSCLGFGLSHRSPQFFQFSKCFGQILPLLYEVETFPCANLHRNFFLKKAKPLSGPCNDATFAGARDIWRYRRTLAQRFNETHLLRLIVAAKVKCGTASLRPVARCWLVNCKAMLARRASADLGVWTATRPWHCSRSSMDRVEA
jgi:hypothetical protein